MTEDNIYKKEKKKQGKRENLMIPYQNKMNHFSKRSYVYKVNTKS